MAPKLSWTMIVRDEEATLGRVLYAAGKFCDELVVVDTGSTDRTRDVAEAAGARVLNFPWVDDFAAARNHVLQAATGDWVLWLDADADLGGASARGAARFGFPDHASQRLVCGAPPEGGEAAGEG